MASHSKTTRDHEEIQRWAEERGAKPAHVKSTGSSEDIGILRLDFPGYSGEGTLEPITWEQFFEKFDERGLAFLYQDETAAGERSNFNKLLSSETADEADESGHAEATGSSPAVKKRARKAPVKKAAVIPAAAPAKKAAAKKTVAKSAVKKAAAKKVAPKKSAPKKAVAKKSVAKKAVKRAAKKAAPKKAAAKKTATKKGAAKKVASRGKQPAKKTAAKKTTKRRGR